MHLFKDKFIAFINAHHCSNFKISCFLLYYFNLKYPQREHEVYKPCNCQNRSILAIASNVHAMKSTLFTEETNINFQEICNTFHNPHRKLNRCRLLIKLCHVEGKKSKHVLEMRNSSQTNNTHSNFAVCIYIMHALIFQGLVLEFNS